MCYVGALEIVTLSWFSRIDFIFSEFNDLSLGKN